MIDPTPLVFVAPKKKVESQDSTHPSQDLTHRRKKTGLGQGAYVKIVRSQDLTHHVEIWLRCFSYKNSINMGWIIYFGNLV